MADKKKAPERLYIKREWTRLFRANEAAVQSKRLTDDQLVKRMQELFPARARATTVLRVGSMRSTYNKGTGLWLVDGPAKTPARRYDERGVVVPAYKHWAPKVVKKKIVIKKKAVAAAG